jgi:type IV pilus assembly protein PilW
MRRGRKKQAGMTLIELLVAMGIGAFLTFGIVNLFLQSKASFYQDEETARLQENGRFALRYVARELSMAGFFGGLTDPGSVTTALSLNTCGTGWAMDTGITVEHVNNATAAEAVAAYSCLSNAEFQPDTDIIAIRRVKDSLHVDNGTVIAAPVNNTVYLRNFQYGSAATLVQGSSITGADKTANSEVDVWQYQPQLLYIRDYSVTSTDGIPSLCRKRLTTSAGTLAVNATECLVEGIENLQVEFGIDSDGDYSPNYYLSAPTAAQLQIAVTARIYILSRAINTTNQYTNDKAYVLGSKSIAQKDDGYFRRVLQTTVSLRNSEAFEF